MLTLNVIFTPRTARHLLPFARSLARESNVGVRLVDNGCPTDEAAAIRDACASSDGLSCFSLAVPAPIEHGLVLNLLFERFPEQHFAIADSDLVANGDFLSELRPLLEKNTAVFSGSPVWAEPPDMVVDRSSTWIGARHRELADGTCIGNSYFAIYRREPLEQALRDLPRGFGVHDNYQLPPALQRAFRGRGWRFVLYDTTRAVNLRLLLDGHSFAHAAESSLHHVGGFSAQHFARRREGLAELAGATMRVLRAKDGARVQRMFESARHRRFLIRSRRDPRHVQMNVRRRLVIEHVRAFVDAILSGAPAPEPPDTLSPGVNTRLRALLRAIERAFPGEHAARTQ